MADEERVTITQKSRISLALAVIAAPVLIYGGSAEMRVERLEQDRIEVHADLKELLRKVDDIRIHIAAMERKTAILEQPVADVRRATP